MCLFLVLQIFKINKLGERENYFTNIIFHFGDKNNEECKYFS